MHLQKVFKNPKITTPNITTKNKTWLKPNKKRDILHITAYLHTLSLRSIAARSTADEQQKYLKMI